MNAGTIRSLLTRKFYINHSDEGPSFFKFALILINGVPAASVDQIIKFGDLVQVNNDVHAIE
jgi:hypothetical protein